MENEYATQMSTHQASDQKSFLRFLYQWVPGIKSFSEIHDMEMKVVDNKYKPTGTTPPTWVPVVYHFAVLPVQLLYMQEVAL